MRNYFLTFVVVVVTVAAGSSMLQAQSVQKSATTKGIPDLTGVWNNSAGRDTPAEGIEGPGFAFDAIGRGGIPRNGFLTKDDPQPSMQPAALEKFNANKQGIGIKDGSTADPNELDPRNSCFPPSPTQFYTIPYPLEIRQLPDQVLILFEYDHWVRRIDLEAKGHPEGYPITWMGHSIGKYDGDTLVVDTVGMHDQTWLDGLGHPHSEDLHLVERFRRLNHDTLEIQLQFDDPKIYTKPWTGKKVLQLMPQGYKIMEHVKCEEFLELGKHQ